MLRSLADVDTIGYDRIAADPAGTQEAFARIGYRLSEALADLIDNSLDADANAVLIRLLRDDAAIREIAVVDNGRGMSPTALKLAMQFGARVAHRPTDRGKYGIGLKSASFSQAQSVTVATRSGVDVSGRRWTVGDIRRGWYCARLSTESAARLLDHAWSEVETAAHGTVVLWDQLDRLPTLDAGVEVTVQKVISALLAELGLVFHRYISDGRMRLIVDSENIASAAIGPPITASATDPFGYPRSGRRGYPKLIDVAMRRLGRIRLEAHIWPPKLRTAEYRLGTGKVASRQGFYFYRNDRLIQAGGWNGVRDDDAEPHLSLARVKIELPVAMDSSFHLKVQKSGVEVPATFREALRRGPTGRRMAAYFGDADRTYRDNKAEPAAEPPLVLAAGASNSLRAATRRIFGSRRETRGLSIEWAELPVGIAFDIDRDHLRLLLNGAYRDKLRAGGRASVNDAPAVKALLYFILREEFDRERRSKASDEMLGKLNELLVALGAR